MWPQRLSPTQREGQAWELQARQFLERQGMRLVEENFRCKSGEIDLIMRDGQFYVFVEVRARASRTRGGAAASITPAKIRRLVHAAQFYLMRFDAMPACRFDVIAFDGGQLDWLSNVIEV